jgi:hypothetical protein
MKVDEVIGFLAPIFLIGICVLLAMGYSDIVYDYVGTVLFYRMLYLVCGGENNITLSTIVWILAVVIFGACISLSKSYPDIMYYSGKSLIWFVGEGVILVYFGMYYQNWWNAYKAD